MKNQSQVLFGYLALGFLLRGSNKESTTSKKTTKSINLIQTHIPIDEFRRLKTDTKNAVRHICGNLNCS
ncbi:MAG: hypothetical protein JNL70_08245 [Saprospiraceae bacterium]|nr:hypothetical protein [Saprospiraceae bacterium]